MSNELVKSIFLFFLARLAEIGGGYLVWLWLSEGRSIWLGIIGGIFLVFYRIIPIYKNSAYANFTSFINSHIN